MPIDVQGDGDVGNSGAVRDVTSRDTILVKADGSVVDAATISATDAVYGITFSFTRMAQISIASSTASPSRRVRSVQQARSTRRKYKSSVRPRRRSGIALAAA